MAYHLQTKCSQHGVEKFQEESIKVIMEYMLFEISGEKMIILLGQLLSKNP
jgi:hypothetical protein